MDRISSRIYMLVIILGVICFISPSRSNAQDNSIVPIQLARKAAIYNAREIFGEVNFYEAETYYDLDDKPAVYVFTLFKGGSSPLKEKVLQEVANERASRKQLESESKSTQTEKIAQSWRKMLQVNQFVTVIASATFDKVPIIAMYRGLPPHTVALEDTKELARTKLGTQNVQLEKFVCCGNFDFLFELSGNGQNIMVSPLNFQTIAKSELSKRMEAIKTEGKIFYKKPEKRKQLLQQKWLLIKNLPAQE